MAKTRWGTGTGNAIAIGLVIFIVLICAGSFLYAQSSNGQITGLVTDSTGAAVEGAKITATNQATGVTYTNTSNGAGIYVLSQLVPGPYDVLLIRDGFASVSRPGITVHIGDRLSIDFLLKPAVAKETVTVTEAVPLLQADTTSAVTVLDNKMITELPQLNRNTLDLTQVTPAVQGQGPLSDNVAALGNAAYLMANNGNSFAVGGGQVNGTSISVDGNQVQDAEFNATNRAIPTPDSVGEFRVESGVLTADRGRYSGGVITMSTKSGTNQIHGRLFEYFRNQIMNANSWYRNSAQQERPVFHQNNYGLSLGGPITIPHLYEGKDRSFFFFAWEGERYITGQTVVTTVPTPEQQRGDFSKTILGFAQNGSPIYASIFDPYHLDGSGNRLQYAGVPGAAVGANGLVGGKICSAADISGGTCPGGNNGLSLQSTLFAHYMALYPAPNQAPGADGYSNNRIDTIKNTRPTDRFFVRLDHNLSNSQRFNLSLSRSRMRDNYPAPYPHAALSETEDHGVTGSLQYNYVISPTSILDAHLGFGVAKLYSNGVSGNGSAPDPNIDVTTWGFDPLIINNPSRTTKNIAPVLNIAGVNGAPGISNVGGSEFDTFINQTINGTVAFTKVVGRHTFKVGYEQMYLTFNEHGGDHTGVAWINNGGGSQQFWQNGGDTSTGFPLAELMMGSSHAFQWGNWNISPYGWNEAAYVMDDWKVNKKLTIQLGVRWDHDGGRTPKSYAPGQSSGILYDMNAKNVLTPNAGWNWGQVTALVPGLGTLPSPAWLSQGATGRVVLINSPEYPQKNLYNTNWKNFQPRFGLAYAFDPNTVLHASAGIIYQGLNGLSTDWFSFYYNSITFSQTSTLDGQHWISELGPDHGLRTFPNGLGYFPPIKTNADYSYQTYGQQGNPDQGGAATIGHFDSPEDYTWDISVQRQLGRNWVASADYTGIRGVHLLMPVWGWSTNNIPVADYPLGQNLFNQVPNPFSGQSQTFAQQPDVPAYQLLGLSPQYAGGNLGITPGQATWGRSRSTFLNFQIQTKAYRGLTLLASFNYRHTMTNTAGKDIQHSGPAGRGLLQNPHNLMEAYAPATYEVPRTLLLNYSYELPFGKGRQYMNGTGTVGEKILNRVVGGWNIAGVTTWMPVGTPVLMPQIQVHPNGSGAQTVPDAALRYSAVPGQSFQSSTNYGAAVVGANGCFVNGGCAPNHPSVLNKAGFGDTPDFGFGNTGIIMPGVRNPGGFFTDATLLKKFYISGESKYVEIRMEAVNIFNHANYGPLDNQPSSGTFGGVLQKGQPPYVAVGQPPASNSNNPPRTMQIGLRIFF